MNSRIRHVAATVATVALAASASVWAAGDQRLADAVQRKDAAAATALLKQAADVNGVQPDGATALAWAAHWDDVKLAGQLIEASADVNRANELGITPLMLAAANGSAPMVKLLLKASANPNMARTTGETALTMAARSGNEEAVQLLLAAGADPKARTARGQTALMWAAAERHAGAAKLLLDAGADVMARNSAHTPPNRNYAGRQDTDVARGPRPLLKDNEAMNPEYRRDLMRAREGAKAEGGFTPLLYAVLGGDAGTVSVLLDRGAKVNDTSADGTTPLLLSLVKRHEQLAVLLLERGADPNMAGPGYAPLHVAAATNQVAAVKALLARGAKPNAPMEKPVSFTEAFVQGTKVSPGAGWVDIKGATPFMIAARTVNVPAMRELLAAGADPKLTAEDGTTAMMLAAGLGKRADADIGYFTWDEKRAIEAITLTLELGIDINAANQDGETALHAAAYHAANRIIQLLVEKGANLNLKNWQGQTPLRIALGHLVCCTTFVRHAGTVDLLKTLGADPAVGTQLNFGLGGYAGAAGSAASKQQ